MLLFVTIVRIASIIIVTVCVIHVFYNFIIIIITYISYNRNLTLQPQPYITTATLHYNRNLTLKPQPYIKTATLHYNPNLTLQPSSIASPFYAIYFYFSFTAIFYFCLFFVLMLRSVVSSSPLCIPLTPTSS